MIDTLRCPKCQTTYQRERGRSGIRLCPNARCRAPVDANPVERPTYKTARASIDRESSQWGTDSSFRPRFEHVNALMTRLDRLHAFVRDVHLCSALGLPDLKERASVFLDEVDSPEVPVVDVRPASIVVELPDTEVMRTILDTMATLAIEDEAPFLDGEASDAESVLKGSSRPKNRSMVLVEQQKIEKLRKMRDAYVEFHKVVTDALHPEQAAVVESPKVGDKFIYATPHEQYKMHDGKVCQVVRVIDEPDIEHDAEVLPMYEVEFNLNGKTIEAWPDELKPVGG